MPQQTYKQMAQALKNAGFTGIQIPIMIAIGLAESGGDTSSVGDNGQSYGVWQIYQPVWGNQFNPTCAADLQCSANATYQISNHGRNFNPWTVFRAATQPETLDPSLRANKFTNYLPSVLTYFGLSASTDWATSLQSTVSGTVDTIGQTVNGFIASWGGNTGGDPIPIIDIPGLPDWAKSILGNLPGVNTAEAVASCGLPPLSLSPLEQAQWAACVAGSVSGGITGAIPGGNLLPSFESIKHGAITVTILGVGCAFIVIGATGLIFRSDTVKSGAKIAGNAVADTAAHAVALGAL
jgi:hypothetical protein